MRREARLVRSNTLAHASILSVINMISPALFLCSVCVYMSVQNGRARLSRRGSRRWSVRRERHFKVNRDENQWRQMKYSHSLKTP